MSASLWDWSLASADGLLTTEEYAMLLDVDILNNDDDLLKTLPAAPSAAPPARPAYPASPASPAYGEDASLYPPSPPSPAESKPSRSELAQDLLLQLDNQHQLFKQENIFSPWLEEKAELPLFPAPGAVAVAVPYAPYPAAPRTDELLREFETVYGHVELTHLTPPHSPPLYPLPLAPAAAPQPPAWLAQQHHAPLSAEELRAAEELVLVQLASPASSPPSSPRSSADSDWSLPSGGSGSGRGGGRGRGGPHARPDERRSRKKEQNKNAATRYRQKKKQEVEVLLTEESELRARHGDLGNKCADLQREIRYLKGLMRDLFKAKGLIK